MSDHRVTTDRQNQRTVVIERLPPFLLLASKETWPSSEDEMDVYERTGESIRGIKG